MRLLIVEDEAPLVWILKKGLEEQGYSIDTASDGEEGLYMAENYDLDAIILDITIPVMDGLTLLKTLRRKGILTPILLLTAKDSLEDKITGLDTGADDYLTKPFEFAELLARVRSLLRRKRQISEALISVGELEINTASQEVRRGDKKIALSAKEYALLECLAYQKNRVVTRQEITEHIYNESFDLDSNIVDVYISYLRNKIDKGFKKKLIRTIRGSGYMLSEGEE